MNAVLVATLFSLGSLVVYVVFHLFCFRAFRPADPMSFLRRLFLASVPAVFVASFLLHPRLERSGAILPAGDVALLFLAAVFFGFLFFTALAFYSIVDHAVRTRFAVEIHRQGGGPITEAALLEICRPGPMVARRLDLMVAGGYLRKNGGTYALEPKGRALAGRIAAIKRFMKIGVGG